MIKQKKKLCYILPEYNVKAYTHFAYAVDFLREISKYFNVYLIVEKGNLPSVELGLSKCSLVGDNFWFWRLIKTKLLILRARFLGYRDFYIHYSFISSFCASIITGIFGGRVFYWNCGLPWNYKKNIFREYFEWLVYMLATYVVTGTETMKGLYAANFRINENKIKVVPNYINLNEIDRKTLGTNISFFRKNLGLPEGKKICLFVHRLSERKGALYLPQIIKNFANKNILFVIVGDGPNRKEIEEKMNRENLMDKVIFTGWLPNDELYKYYLVSNLFIMPSNEEGFPHVLLEAMAAGLPFVAFSVGGVLDVVPDALKENVVESKNIEKFISKMKERLNDDQTVIRQLSANEKEWVKKYDISKVAEMFKKIFF